MSKHPNNGPTFSKATYKKERGPAHSPLRQEIEERDAEKRAAFLKQMSTDPEGWVQEHMIGERK